MQYTVPHYYSQFHCIAGACPDTCCAGWAIMIDKASLKRYRRVKGKLKARLRRFINWRTGAFRQQNGRCAFLNREGLCRIYQELGPDSLCRTCREYPRHTEEFEGVRELSLSLSCMEAARLILSCKEPVRFLTREDDRKENYPDFDFFLFTKLMDARELMIFILQDRKLAFELRMAMVLGISHDMQRMLKTDRLYEADRLFAQCRGEEGKVVAAKRLSEAEKTEESRYELMKRMFQVFDRLEVLKADWPEYMGNLRRLLFDGGEKDYEEKRRAFFAYLKEDGERRKLWDQWGEQLMVYFLFTYFCGAVYDGQIYPKAKLALVSTLMLREMAVAVFSKAGRIELEAMAELAHRYSREVEHSDQNLNALEAAFQTDRRFGFRKLLKAIRGLAL